MFRTSMIAAATVAASTVSGLASAQQAQHDAAAEARAMLDRAVAAVRADKVKALESFNAGRDGFRDRDLSPFCYPFCVDVQAGIYTAHPTLRGKQVLDPDDSAGHSYGEAILRGGGTEGTVDEMTYSFPRPSGGTVVPKATYVTEIGDRICGVGYDR